MLAAVLLIGSTAYAVAADPAVVEEVVVVEPSYNWSGVYVGGQVGYVFDGSAEYEYPESDFYDYNNDLDGLIGGAYVGYNYQFSNNIVLGGEADIAWGDLQGSELASDGNYTGETKLEWMGSLRARLGYAFDRLLPYVTGGVAFGHAKFDETGIGGYDGKADFDLRGWTLGAGAEYAVTDNWILRGEYRYTQFNEKDFTSVTSAGDSADYSVDVHTNDFRIGAAYKF